MKLAIHVLIATFIAMFIFASLGTVWSLALIAFREAF